MESRGANPGVDLALPAAHLGLDVVLDDGGQGGLVGDAADPAGELRMPDGCVAADELVVGRGPVNQVIGLRKVERVAGRLDRVPFHAVLGRDLPKLGLDNGRVLARSQAALVSGDTKILLAMRLELGVETPSRARCGAGSSRSGAGDEGGGGCRRSSALLTLFRKGSGVSILVRNGK